LLRSSLIRIERGLILSSIYDDDYFITEIGMPHIFPNPKRGLVIEGVSWVYGWGGF